MRIDHATTEDVNALSFSGSSYNVNCALKTLRRMMNLAQECGLIANFRRLNSRNK
jgi:hypothetical protein